MKFLGNPMKLFGQYRVAAQILYWKIRYEAYDGNVNKALEDAVVSIKFAKHLQGKKILIEQLVGISIEAVGLHAINEVLETYEISPNSLEQLQRKLEHLSSYEKIIDLEIEKAVVYDYIQNSFTDNGQGNGRMLLKGLVLAKASH